MSDHRYCLAWLELICDFVLSSEAEKMRLQLLEQLQFVEEFFEGADEIEAAVAAVEVLPKTRE